MLLPVSHSVNQTPWSGPCYWLMAQKRKSTGQDQEQDTVPSLLESACTFGVEGMVTKRRGITKCVVETFGTLTQVGYLTDYRFSFNGLLLKLGCKHYCMCFFREALNIFRSSASSGHYKLFSCKMGWTANRGKVSSADKPRITRVSWRWKTGPFQWTFNSEFLYIAIHGSITLTSEWTFMLSQCGGK